ncbi:hypothetical protein [Mobiluncus mulieris]|uniref:Uncharacterized protein n=1 Tax=Mobiluncus mulieris TaxID=2052 RepID=A0ABD4TWB9_9ACTO|nr:hypothetical protein [Mobiluncus mulieris]MCU9968680.1 hypothetical protein [Mobiluncus mulieris]MCU9973166.1 hypothetical protein [Mobiluncus mulieris]MCV0008730.1 hypothetical protein [Mobiluncus mulieris]NMX19499.1 hypothetical protein [Mobiluncus mulieris]
MPTRTAGIPPSLSPFPIQNKPPRKRLRQESRMAPHEPEKYCNVAATIPFTLQLRCANATKPNLTTANS